MDRIVEVTGGRGGNAFLIQGEKKAALIDCGMAYCASNLINNIKKALKSPNLNYILISHSHYDHIGAIPYLKEEWPNSMVLGAERALQILNSPNALKTIRSLSIQAAKLYGTEGLKEYDDRRLKVDAVIRDGDVIAPGDLNIKVIETLGHTKCSLSFLVNNETLFASESTGCRGKTGRIYPGFVTSYYQAIASIHKCEKLNPRHIISPHFGLVNKTETATYWKSCIRAAEAAKEFILNLLEQGYDEDRILTEYEVMFRDEENRLEQPLNAFILNAQRMIKAVEYTKLCDEKVV